MRVRYSNFLAIVLVFLIIASSALAFSPSRSQSAGVQVISPSVSSNGQEQQTIVTQVALSTDHSKVVYITGGETTQKNSGGSLKNWFYMYVDLSRSGLVSTSGIIQNQTISANTNNIYWNGQTSLPNTQNYGTVGQDLDNLNGVLSEWQYIDANYVFSGRIQPINYSGSYGSPGCHIDSLGQERHSVYTQIVDASSGQVYQITGAELLEYQSNGVTTTNLVIFIDPSNSGHLARSGQTQTCGVTQAVNPSTAMGWFTRSPPTTDVIHGNFGILGTTGAQLTIASTGALVVQQFLDRTYEFGNPVTTSSSSTSTSTTTITSTTTATSTTSKSTSSATTSKSTSTTTFTTTSTTTITTGNLAIDSSAQTACSITSTTCSLSLSTARSSDLIVLLVGMANQSAKVSSVNSPPLSFSSRAAEAGNTQSVSEWYVLASSALSSQTITVTRSAGSFKWHIMAFAVSGVNQVSPFDPAVPCRATGSSGSPTCSLSTSNAKDMIIGLGDQGGLTEHWTSASGFTFVLSSQSGKPMLNSEYEIVSTAQNNLAVSVSSTGTNGWVWLGDAIQSG
jgi:hypothetical protein